MIDESTARERRARFEAMFDETYEPLLAYARRRVAGDADDVVAETFTVAWRRLDDVPRDPLPWLYGVAWKVISDQRRAGRRRQALVERIHVESRDPLAGPAPESRILAALARLSAADREALLLVAWEGLDATEAATALGCSAVAFRVRLRRARKRLRVQLTQLDDDRTGRVPASVVAQEVETT